MQNGKTFRYKGGSALINMTRGKELPFKQVKGYGCGLYCMANLFNSSKALGYLDSKYRKRYYGMYRHEEDKILAKVQPSYIPSKLTIDALVYMNKHLGYRIPIRLFKKTITWVAVQKNELRSDRWITPYMLSVQSQRYKHKLHRVYVLIDNWYDDKDYHLLDPVIGYMYSTKDILDIYKYYKRVYEIDIPRMDNYTKQLIINHTGLEHLIK